MVNLRIKIGLAALGAMQRVARPAATWDDRPGMDRSGTLGFQSRLLTPFSPETKAMDLPLAELL